MWTKLLDATTGQVVGLVGVGHDITERKRIQHALEQHQELLDITHRFAHIGTWEWDIENTTLRCNQQAAHLLGTTLDHIAQIKTLEALLSLICDEDREKVREAIVQCLKGAELDVEYRLRSGDSPAGPCCVAMRFGIPKVIASGYWGVVQDITHIKNVEARAIDSISSSPPSKISPTALCRPTKPTISSYAIGATTSFTQKCRR